MGAITILLQSRRPANTTKAIIWHRVLIVRGAPTVVFSSGREDEFGRISGLDAGNQGVCIPGSWRCWRVPVTPERRAGHGSIRASVLQMSVETDAERHWCRCPGAWPNV